MDAHGYLLTTCEVALGFTGFASLLLALAPRGPTPPAVYQFRIYSLLTSSLGCLFLALLSLALLAFGVEEITTWRWSSFAMAVVVASSFVFGVPLSRRARAESADWLSSNKAVLVFLLLASPVNMVLQAANSVLVFAPPFPLFFVGLVAFLLYAATGLVQTLVDTVQGRSIN